MDHWRAPRGMNHRFPWLGGAAVARWPAIAALSLAACGGGGSSGGGTVVSAAPTVSLTANPTSLTGSGTAALAWTSANASSCTASDGWSGAQATAGNFTSATISNTTTFTLSCSGAGGSAAASATVTVSPVGNAMVSGQITFDKVPFSAVAANGLDFTRCAAPLSCLSPARGVVVEAIAAAGGATLANSVTDANGQYSLSVPANTGLFVRARAQMLRSGTPSWNFTVRDNTGSDALYVLDGSSFNSSTVATVRNLNAPSGWGGVSYTGTRAAAPFAILDTVYQAYSLVLSANAAAVFPTLQLEWSTRNVPTGNGSSTELAAGQIGTTFFTGAVAPNPARIYVLGQADTDTDEYDNSVIAHEWGHYYQNAFSRDDSIGGNHRISDKLDARLAFSEGWGNAFSGMVRGDPIYRDSFGTMQHQDFSINVETVNSGSLGWYSEDSVQNIIWDVFDSAADAGDNVALGFAPIHAAMTGGVRNNSGLTTIYPLMRALISANSAQATALGALLSAQNIVVPTDDFGSGESNSGGLASNLPVYAVLNSGSALGNICSTTVAGSINHLGNRRLLRFDVTGAGTHTATIVATGPTTPTASDPDLVLYAAGVERARAELTTAGTETLTASSLSAGTYVVELYEYSNVAPNATARGTTCFNVQLTLN